MKVIALKLETHNGIPIEIYETKEESAQADKIDEFCRLYKANVPTRKICAKLGINEDKLRELTKWCKEKGMI